jgi:hypothetical protein
LSRRSFGTPVSRLFPHIQVTSTYKKGSNVITAFRKVLMAVAFIAGLSASAVVSAQVVNEVLAYKQLEA